MSLRDHCQLPQTPSAESRLSLRPKCSCWTAVSGFCLHEFTNTAILVLVIQICSLNGQLSPIGQILKVDIVEGAGFRHMEEDGHGKSTFRLLQHPSSPQYYSQPSHFLVAKPSNQQPHHIGYP